MCVAPGGREDFTKRVMMMLALEVSHSETLRPRLTLNSYTSLSQKPEITVSDALWTSMTKQQFGNLSPGSVRLTSRGGKVPSKMLRPDDTIGFDALWPIQEEISEKSRADYCLPRVGHSSHSGFL